MKYVLSLMFLVLLVSCSDEEVVQRSCTLNDQPVDCAVLDGTASTSSSSSVKELKVSAEIGYNTFIDRDGEMVLTLEPTFKEVVSGDKSCSIDTRESNRLNYEVIDGNLLRLKFDDGSYVDMDRIRSASSNELIGKWKGTSYDGDMIDMILTFHFKENGKVILENTCKY